MFTGSGHKPTSDTPVGVGEAHFQQQCPYPPIIAVSFCNKSRECD